jgi:ABC-type nitrate/sulfonate/bicarbonate transport system substrate-binding protein
LGGVPEHFNAPVQLGLQNGIFQKYELDVVFKEVPEGSGKMCAALRGVASQKFSNSKTHILHI